MNKKKITFISASVIVIILLLMPLFGPFGFNKFNITQVRLTTLEIAIKAFSKKYHKLPKGDNEKITAVLLGYDKLQNPKGIRFVEPHKPVTFLWWERIPGTLDRENKYIDAWGTPVIFELDSNAGKYAVKSFGPNRINDNSKGDDIIIKGSVNN